MEFLKQNIFGILSILVGCILMYDTYLNTAELNTFKNTSEVGQYIAVEERVEVGENQRPSLMAGGLKVSLIFLTFLLVLVVLAIVHKRRKGSSKVLYAAIGIIVINFLFFPYFLTKLI